MKKILALTSISMALLLAGYYFYSASRTASGESLWDLVPADAVAVFEYKPSAPTNIRATGWTAVQHAFGQDSVFLDPKTETLTSFHITGKEDFGVVYYRHDSMILQTKAFRGAAHLPKRAFEGYPLRGIMSGNRDLWYTVIGSGFLFSRHSFLIEDAIRTAKAEGTRTVRKKALQQHPTDLNSGNLYLNLGLLTRFIGVFFRPEINRTLFGDLGGLTMADMKMENQTLTLSGFTQDSLTNSTSSLSLFTEQHPVLSSLRKIVPNRTLFFVHFGISDFTAWNTRRQKYCSVKRPDILLRMNERKDLPHVADFYGALGPEIGQAYADVNGKASEVLLLVLKSQSAERVNAVLSKSAKPIEYYSGYPIHKFTAPDLMSTLLWPLTENKNLSFYCLYGNYLAAAEDVDNLKRFISDNEEDNTWGKSIEWNSFFSGTPAENSIGLAINGELASSWLQARLSPLWMSTPVPEELSGLGKASLQLGRVDRNYSFNGVVQLALAKPQTSEAVRSSVSRRTFSDFVTQFSPVRNHATEADEWIVQTTKQTVELLSSDLKSQFDVKVSGAVRGGVHQVDFYKNKKLQYLFATGKTLYLIDRKGRPVDGFPKTLATGATIDFMSVADYDNTRNYRYLIGDEKGSVYITDKEGKMLPGWNPKALGTRLFDAPRSVRALGKDFIVCLDERGTVYAFNRKGDRIGGFPVKTGIQPQGGWIFEKLNATDEGVITMVSRDGIKVQVNMSGKVVTRENFVRSSPDSKFSMLTSPGRPTYWVSRIDRARLSVLDEKGKVIFEKENPGSDHMEASCAELPSGRFFLFYDGQQEFTYLFTGQGRPVFARPLEATQLPWVIQKQGGRIGVFVVYKNQVRKIAP
jgi:hypothetical protein